MLRRRFMLVCTAAVTGLWFRPTGFTTLSRKIVIALSGNCSFCGKSIEEIQSLAGAVGTPTRICDECVGLCLDILDEEWLPLPREYRPELDHDHDHDHDHDREEQAILRNLEKVRAAVETGAYAIEIERMIADSRRRIDGARTRSSERLQERQEQLLLQREDALLQKKKSDFKREHPHLFCTFCDAHQSNVRKLIAGPQVYICDGCVGEAALVTKALLDRRFRA